MINYLSKFNCLSIKLITCQNKLIADQRMIDYSGQSPYTIATEGETSTNLSTGAASTDLGFKHREADTKSYSAAICICQVTEK